MWVEFGGVIRWRCELDFFAVDGFGEGGGRMLGA